MGMILTGILLLFFSCPSISQKGLEVAFLDVGQGDSVVLREGGGLACLVDGGSSDVSQVGKYRIEPYLKSRGIARLDYVFVSHGDQDHINGIQEMICRQATGVKIGCLVFPPVEVWDEHLRELHLAASQEGISTAQMSRGDVLGKGELRLQCLGPDTDQIKTTGNEASLVLQASYGELDLLLTGDVEGQGELALTEALETPIEILKTAHHGSRNSTSEKFLEAAGAQLAILSAGRNNQYGHPHKETLERLEKKGVAALCTANSGAVILQMEGKEVENLEIIQYNMSYEKFE